MGHFLWGTGIGAHAFYNEFIKFIENVVIGFGLYAADSHSTLSNYFPLAAFQNSWINFCPRHGADVQSLTLRFRDRPNCDTRHCVKGVRRAPCKIT